MGRKLTKEIVLGRFSVTHGDLYDYSEFEFNGVDTKSIMLCRAHGEFLQTPSWHSRGHGCPECGHALRNASKLERFSKAMVADFRAAHGMLYDYSKAWYVSAKDKVIIICSKHGEFLQSPNHHKQGQGCPVCAEIILTEQRSKGGDFPAFKEKCLSVGRTELEIHLCGFEKMQKDVSFFCHVHGEYSISASRASKGDGCSKCSHVTAGLASRITTEEFIRRAMLVHAGDGLSYEKTVYVTAKHKVIITCRLHGDFEQEAESHLNGCGCPKCTHVVSKGEMEIAKFLEDLGVSTITSDRKFLGARLELDIRTDAFAIEYNGVYWHSVRLEVESNRPKGWARTHMLNKKLLCEEKGLPLIHVMSSDNPLIIRKMLAQRSGKDEERYFARKCEVHKCRSNKGSIVEEFYIRNHIQGNASGCDSYYLTVNNEIVAAMSFSLINSERGSAQKNRYELRRYATCCSVVGGASRLLKAFTRDNPEFSEIISYSDNRLFSGDMYPLLGFNLVKELEPSYSYTKGDKIVGKSNFQKSRLAVREGFDFDVSLTERQNCINNGWYQIWDCGKKKWSLQN